MKTRILKFPENGLLQLHFFTDNLSFPVAVATYSEQENNKLLYLIRLVQQNEIHSTYALCRWCITQHMTYQIIYPMSVKSVIRHPIKVYDYLRLTRLLNQQRQKDR